MTLGLVTTTAASALSRETPTKETSETPKMHVETHERLLVRIRETLKRRGTTSVGRWWLVWVSGGRQWVSGSRKAANVACRLAASQTALDIGNQNAPKTNTIWPYMILYP
jgi:hypothetical protein